MPHLVPVWDVQKWVCSRDVWVMGVQPPSWSAGTDCCQLLRKVDEGNQVTADRLQLCHLQKSLRKSDLPDQWQVSKALGVLETLTPPWLSRKTLLADDVLPASG